MNSFTLGTQPVSAIMNQPNSSEIIITRDPGITDASAPWEGLKFRLPLGSDALFDKLRSMYPNCTDHQQRKRRALIDFLHYELDKMESIHDPNSTPQPQPGESNCPTETDSMRSTESPSFSPAPIPVSQNGLAGHSGGYAAPAASLSPLRRQSGDMTHQISVFDSKDGKVVKPKERRRMNENEKLEYKAKRLVGACVTCRASKKKCRCREIRSLDRQASPPGKSAHETKRKPSSDPETSKTTTFKIPKTQNTPSAHRSTDTSGADPLVCVDSPSAWYVTSNTLVNTVEQPLPPGQLPWDASDHDFSSSYDLAFDASASSLSRGDSLPGSFSRTHPPVPMYPEMYPYGYQDPGSGMDPP
ncbi:hypothetical protein GQ43DRAFT_57276 [Delitschia confertaspora ATCC 74209]|uniref:Uncharacterized protein n=1 Tax=Delitschia confertaspora ATCC 74209 TaxID=1513339 RepID=A0A9P4JPG7_9PLEO|nr:hypothetical protein GQ43DRAFT_57276 [Delitschia confertaspora ATCC 74209]